MKVWFQPPCGCRSLRQVAWAWGWCRPWWWLRRQEPPASGTQSRRGWAPLGLGVETTRLGHGGSKVPGAGGLETTSSLLPKVVLILSMKFPCTTASRPRPPHALRAPSDRVQGQPPLLLPSQKGLSSLDPKADASVPVFSLAFSEMLCTWVIVFRLDICIIPFVQVTDSNLCPHFAIQKFPWMGTLWFQRLVRLPL